MAFIGTVSGRTVDFDDPDPSSISIADIAIGLSHICRFAGQVDVFYSVAQHSVLVAEKVWLMSRQRPVALQGLLHDASEAFLGDWPTPLKKAVGPAFCSIEDRLQQVIYSKYGVPDKMRDIVHDADQRWVITERNQLQPQHCEWSGYEEIVPYADKITVWPCDVARLKFMWWFNYLNLGRAA